MKLAIFSRKGSFSDGWLDYCRHNGIPFIELSPYDNDIVRKISDCDAVLWHHHHSNKKDKVFAKQLLFSIQQSGKLVFPDFNSGWHFDDKLGQKYLLEGVDAPLVPSFAFFDKETALAWASSTDYPKVFKLRGGAGSSNVKLVRSKKQAIKLINRCFGKGFKELEYWKTLRYQWDKYRSGLISMRNMLNFSIGITRQYFRMVNNREHGYAYFQEFMPGNTFDVRVIVIGDKVFAIKRLCRANDFRASGSGRVLFNKDEINEECVRLSFDIAKRLNAQCVGFDWVHDSAGHPKIVEIGYGFTAKSYNECQGYWTSDLEWHEGKGFDFCGWMVEDLIARIGNGEK